MTPRASASGCATRSRRSSGEQQEASDAERRAARRSGRLRQHLRPVRRDDRRVPGVEITGATDVDRALSAEFVEALRRSRLPLARRAPRRRRRRRGPQPDVARRPRGGDHRGARGRQARPQREAARGELRGGTHARRARRRPGRPSLVLADHVHGRRAGEAWRLIASGAIGTVRVAYAEVNWGRIESWHPRPEPFYRIGPLADVGVYPLTILTAMFGPARRVTAFGRIAPAGPRDHERRAVHRRGSRLRCRRRRARGRADRPPHDELLRVQHSKQRGIEFHGDDGSVFLSSWQDFDAPVELARNGPPPSRCLSMPSAASTGGGRSPSSQRHRRRAAAPRDGRPCGPCRRDPRRVVESATEGRPVEVRSSFARVPVPSFNGSGPG